MGSGEFGGGGSVRWQVRYDAHEDVPDPGGPHKNQGKGKDNDPETSYGKKMRVVCKKGTVTQDKDGKVIVEVTLENDRKQVVVTWGEDLNAAV
ncbi:MAG TPA: hypothetical protein VKB50_28630 [Vicinamibacterales bacterium]|nr:hypothetical protein [Vicinamibacterales bacterium]